MTDDWFSTVLKKNDKALKNDKSTKIKFYSLDKIIATNSQYNFILGERSNGKSYACMEMMIKKYAQTGEQSALLRRWDEDFKGKRGSVMFDAHVSNGAVEKYTNGRWTGVYYYASKWYFCNTDEDGKRTVANEPFCYGFSISAMEHDKSTSYPNITTIVFDEVTSRNGYLPDEFTLFMNVLSTIIRQRDNVKIFMLGNTVSKVCPYFNEMGLTNIKKMEVGTIDIYTYGDSELRVAVEFCESNAKSKASNVYFAFNNPHLEMIKGTGSIWEMDIYPHAPCKWLPKNELFKYFIRFDGELLQCEVVRVEDGIFTFIHRKTTPIKDESKDIIFEPTPSIYPTHFQNIRKPTTPVTKKIASLFTPDRLFYQDNEVGEIVREYLLWCKA